MAAKAKSSMIFASPTSKTVSCSCLMGVDDGLACDIPHPELSALSCGTSSVPKDGHSSTDAIYM